ncbi:hypothetical protein V5P93_007081 [Actinokineospora auranticolor]|uniref:Uncharacterized protein n=1 Tax=Actinokineospora auranticolor TaxID=155976 RepID=A0A2S6GGV8_9PSEU|nr:hypothetical protein [Actinokineospora auranticolor]PPK64468.1 hypothetical protein CLV40_11932 [Actinokineospora auranticolor]
MTTSLAANSATNSTVDAGRAADISSRYLHWDHYVRSRQKPTEQARTLQGFASEFDALPPLARPFHEWGAEMANLCRRMARSAVGLENPPLYGFGTTAG